MKIVLQYVKLININTIVPYINIILFKVLVLLNTVFSLTISNV